MLRIGGEETKYLAVDYVAPPMFAGSLFDLQPATAYEVALRMIAARDTEMRCLVVRENMRRFAAGERMYSVFDLARGYWTSPSRDARASCRAFMVFTDGKGRPQP